MKRAVVTGGTGFIGSWLLQELLGFGYDVTVIVRDKGRLLPELCRQCCVVESDLLIANASLMAGAEGSDVFFHFAWAGVSTEQKNNLSMQLTNLPLAVRALELAHEVRCRRFIAAGTVAEYVFGDGTINPRDRQAPNDIYGASKVAVHTLLEVRARQLSMPFNWLLLPSTYGERRIDSNIITYTIKSLLKSNKPRYGNLRQMWDFLHVEDVARAVRMVAEYGDEHKVYGIGSGVYRPLRAYIENIRDIISPEAELGIGEIVSMSDKTFSSCVNIYDLCKDTGFMPSMTFDCGIRRTVKWWQQRLQQSGNSEGGEF